MAKNQDATGDSSSPDDQPRRKRRPRRATVPGTGPASADGPEPRLEDVQPKAPASKKPPLSSRDRWIHDEKPPHY
ncbi:hypothetical protein [Enteractinococcus coprophilus]|uniref:hypothetical protein n=1 Tax=Enteractinococcus coprophilus TaxID=1027633 RepID=UPI001154420E|nr:hypothetical protein [Enteractinococcus coprophilus]